MARRIDPRHSNFIDANVLDRSGGPDDAVVDEILALVEASKIPLLLPHSVKSEIEHPNTPSEVKRRAAGLLYSKSEQLTALELDLHKKVRSILQGNAKEGKHDRDAYHIVESSKYGRYFITNDTRILKKRPQLAALLEMSIVTPAEFLDLYRCFESGAI